MSRSETVIAHEGYVLSAVTLCARFKSTKVYLMGICLVGAAVMAASWLAPSEGLLWPLMMLNGFATAMMGPVIQAMPVMLPEIGSYRPRQPSGRARVRPSRAPAAHNSSRNPEQAR